MGIYIQYILYSLVLILYLNCGGGFFLGGGGNVFLAFILFPTFLEKKNLGINFFFRKTILFHLMFSSCFFYARSISNIFRILFVNIEKCPFTYWLIGMWFLQIVDIGNFNMKLNGMWFPQIVDRDSRKLYPI